MADSATNCTTHNAVEWNRSEEMSKTKLVQNFAVVFCKFLNVTNQILKMIQIVHEATRIHHLNNQHQIMKACILKDR